MITHYVSISESNVGVKTAEFFKSQGGDREPWGEHWQGIEAISLYDARAKAIKMRRAKFPDCHLTLGERGEDPESYWPEAKGR